MYLSLVDEFSRAVVSFPFPKGWASEKFRFFGDTWLYGVGDDLESWGVDGRGTQISVEVGAWSADVYLCKIG